MLATAGKCLDTTYSSHKASAEIAQIGTGKKEGNNLQILFSFESVSSSVYELSSCLNTSLSESHNSVEHLTAVERSRSYHHQNDKTICESKNKIFRHTYANIDWE